MRYMIKTPISHGHIKLQITTVGSHGCIINFNINIYDNLTWTKLKGNIIALASHFLDLKKLKKANFDISQTLHTKLNTV